MKFSSHLVKVVFVSIALCLGTATFSQIKLPVVKSPSNVSFHTLNIEDGLATLFIEYILQDKYGFIWIATQYGLNMYDGYEMKVFKSDQHDPGSLSSDFVTKIYEDKAGNIWACTIRGLCRYNRASETFSSFFPDTADINSDYNYILDVEEDSKGMLWVFTPEALFSFNPATQKFRDFRKYHIKTADPWTYYSKFVKRTAEDDDSNVWITSSHGLWKFDRKSGNFYHYTFQPDKPGSISGNDPVAIDRDARGNIWIATKSAGLSRIVFGTSQKGTDGISFKRYSRQSGDLTSDSLINIMAGNKNNLWVMGRNGLARYNPAKDSFIPYTMEGKWVLRMAKSIHGGYWLKTRNDFYWLDTTNNILTEYTDYEGFRNMQKKNFYICNKGCVWTTFEGYGIHMIYSWKNPLMQLFNETKPEGLSADQRKINRILIDKKDNLWLGTYGGLIRVPRFSGGFVKGFRTYSHDPSDKYSLPHNNILALLETKDGSIWIGTENGLSKYIPENERFQNFNHEPNNPLSLQQKYVHDLCEDSRGILWVQTQNGPDLLDREAGRFYHLNDFSEEVNDDYFVAIAEDSSGAVWLGDFEKGLTRIEIPGKLPGKENVIKEVLNSFQVRHFRNIPSEPYSLSGNSIVSLYTDSKKRFWVGTGNGLNLFLPEQNQFICINKTDGLENETICGILDDSEGNIWLSSKRGITKIIPANHQVSIDFKKGLTLINFSMGDGLQGLEYIEKSFFKSGSGTMFFGGFNGFNYFDPDSVQAVTDFPVPYLTGFYKLNNRVFFEKPLYEMDTIRLKYHENKFSIEFVGLGFKKNNRVKYRYMLENFDKEWTISGKERKAGYMSLSPGEYRFKVQVSNESGDWNNQFASVFILINPPFWNTWWFKSLAILCTFLLVFFFVKSREQNLKLQKRKLESQVKERTIEISLRNTELQQKQEELRAQNQEIAIQRDMLDFQNKSINESILYAKRIQSAVLPRQEYIDEILPENFIFFKPRDIVSGDFYWIRQVNHYVVIAVADCTGHGVPGAIMSMLGITLLNEILHKREITSTNQALNELRKQVKQTLRQTGKRVHQIQVWILPFVLSINIPMFCSILGQIITSI